MQEPDAELSQAVTPTVSDEDLMKVIQGTASDEELMKILQDADEDFESSESSVLSHDAAATQRVFLDRDPVTGQIPSFTEATRHNAEQKADHPQGGQRKPSRPASSDVPRRKPQNTGRQQNSGDPHRKRFSFRKKDKVTLIVLISIVVIMLAAIIGTVCFLFSKPKDDGKILNNVIAAGINLGGMTPEEATAALHKATDNTYTQLDMVIQVLDAEVKLSPADTGARLDVDSVVKDAYDYGRTGSTAERKRAKNHALANSYIVPIQSHLNLNTTYIQSVVDELGSKFSSTLTQPTVTVNGERPEMGVAKPDTTAVHQTMDIFVGTPEYGLNTKQLFDQVLDYYNINIFKVVATCTVVAPDPLDEKLAQIFSEVCVAPVDAQINPDTFEVTPEVYGYGFVMDEVKAQIADAAYGTTLQIPLRFIAPAITEELLSSDLFKDTLGKHSSSIRSDAAWKNNVTLAAKKIDGMLLKAGGTFSFNQVFGELKTADGYQTASVYVGTHLQNEVGGGVSQVASLLYSCALEADLDILERHSNTYLPDYIEKGLDAYVAYGKADLSFRNNTSHPIRINAKVEGSTIKISLTGTNSRNYVIKMDYEVTKTYKPRKLVSNMTPENPGGYKQDQVIVTPITGYDINVYRCKYDKSSGRLLSRNLESMTRYASRDSVTVNIIKPAEPTQPPVGTAAPTEAPPAQNSDSSQTQADIGD